jgi:hypothetical protein
MCFCLGPYPVKNERGIPTAIEREIVVLEFTDLAADVAALDLDSLTTRSLSVTSDIRSKKHIELFDVNDAVDIVNKLGMYEYRYREGDQRQKIGVILSHEHGGGRHFGIGISVTAGL